MTRLAVGTKLGRYEIVVLLGAGRMGEVLPRLRSTPESRRCPSKLYQLCSRSFLYFDVHSACQQIGYYRSPLASRRKKNPTLSAIFQCQASDVGPPYGRSEAVRSCGSATSVHVCAASMHPTQLRHRKAEDRLTGFARTKHERLAELVVEVGSLAWPRAKSGEWTTAFQKRHQTIIGLALVTTSRRGFTQTTPADWSSLRRYSRPIRRVLCHERDFLEVDFADLCLLAGVFELIAP